MVDICGMNRRNLSGTPALEETRRDFVMGSVVGFWPQNYGEMCFNDFWWQNLGGEPI